MTIQIKNRCTGKVIAKSKNRTLKDLASDFRANLSGADLSKANLFRANLYEADLYGADLSETYLSGANLSEVKGIVSFTAERELAVAFFHAGETKLKIGCEVHTLEYWASNYKKILENQGYKSTQIAQYGLFIKAIKSLKR
jgi:hypothetical protein